jgi:hypothetical protein
MRERLAHDTNGSDSARAPNARDKRLGLCTSASRPRLKAQGYARAPRARDERLAQGPSASRGR